MSASASPDDYEGDWSQTEPRSPAERSRKRQRTAAFRDHQNQETGLMRDGDNPGLPRFVGSSSGIHFVRTVYGILSRTGNQLSVSHLVPGEDDQLDDARESVAGSPATPGTGARTPLWRSDEVVQGGNHKASDITFDTLIAWTKSYFEIWHPVFPFLHGPEVVEILEQVANNGLENISPQDAAIVRAVVSISLADTRQLGPGTDPGPGPVPLDLVFSSLDHLASSLHFVLGTPASLKNMQAALCVELFLVSMLKFNMASRIGGVAVRMAYHLGLHRCPRRYQNFNPHEVSMRKRIWWSFYCLERLVCQALGLPLDVQDSDVDVCFSHDVEYHQQANSEDEQYEDESNAQLKLLTLLSKHAQIRGMILELRHKSLHVRQDTLDRSLLVQSKLTRWTNVVHESYESLTGEQTDDEDQPGPVAAGQSGVDRTAPLYHPLLLILQHESTIALNRPLLAKTPRTSASQAALEACIGASRGILETVSDQQSDCAGRAFSAALMVWPLLTWSVWMSCFILSYAALEGVTSISSALRSVKREIHVLNAPIRKVLAR
ncbi:hypothetical protein KVR01_003879 [Diaporthe batatas]|uniref:uncharacterized protein n=1 Tax=Diaporthe batatas TaxID=748121 RepID=UPI001D03888F|nr:uncharacterized protein KVR01_003879 [Diaporthe batatas]KAG8168190.1 hypothetical protein KVR01_003879 [Diaporthe batatas]